MITLIIIYWTISYLVLSFCAITFGKTEGMSTKEKTIAYTALFILAGLIFPIFLMELFDRFRSD